MIVITNRLPLWWTLDAAACSTFVTLAFGGLDADPLGGRLDSVTIVTWYRLRTLPQRTCWCYRVCVVGWLHTHGSGMQYAVEPAVVCRCCGCLAGHTGHCRAVTCYMWL
jgi:hypothetical protein